MSWKPTPEFIGNLHTAIKEYLGRDERPITFDVIEDPTVEMTFAIRVWEEPNEDEDEILWLTDFLIHDIRYDGSNISEDSLVECAFTGWPPVSVDRPTSFVCLEGEDPYYER